MADVPNLLLRWREHKEVTQQELAKGTGLAQGTLSRYEGEWMQPTVYTLEKICDFYGITLSEFFEGPSDYE